MRSGNTFLFLLVPYFLLLIFFNNASYGQLRKGVKPRHRSFYLSAGYNKAQFFNSTIKVDQPSLGNNYSLLKVKADTKTGITSLVPWQLNYRLGYYWNYYQTMGVEVEYNPVNYHIITGENIQLKGALGGIPNTTKTITFYAKNGYYYGMDGANLLLVNLVRRFTIYRPNSNRFAVDAIAKLGAGPAMPHLVSNLPGSNGLPSTTWDDPQLQLKGWNGAGEAALRVTIDRYVYVELAGKYDYAVYNHLKIYEGTATQNVSTLEAILSVGITLPSNRYNPLFHHEKNIITILPFFLDKKNEDSVNKAEADQKRADGLENEKIEDVPEFGDIVDKRTRRENKRIADSTYKQFVADSTANKIITDSIANKNMQDSMANRVIQDSISNKRMVDSLAEKALADSIAATMPIDSTIKAPVDSTAKDHKETKKEKKARLQKEQEEQQQKAHELKEQQQNNAQEQKDNGNSEDKEKAAQEQKEKELKDKEKQEQDKQAEKDKKAADKQAKKDKKAAEKQAKKDKKEQEKRDKEQQKEKDRQAKEDQDKKDKEEKDKPKEEGK
jgi:hypothetical protein